MILSTYYIGLILCVWVIYYFAITMHIVFLIVGGAFVSYDIGFRNIPINCYKGPTFWWQFIKFFFRRIAPERVNHLPPSVSISICLCFNMFLCCSLCQFHAMFSQWGQVKCVVIYSRDYPIGQDTWVFTIGCVCNLCNSLQYYWNICQKLVSDYFAFRCRVAKTLNIFEFSVAKR